MAKINKRNSKKIKYVILFIIILLICLLFSLSEMKNKSNNQTDLEKANIKYQEERKREIAEDLSEKDEQQRMQYYCGNFFKLIDTNQYEEAYDLLYSEYKENYFPTIQNFKKYFIDYFPSDFALSYSNFDRLGDIYVLTVGISDTVNGSYGKNFSLYVVIQENALNNYVLSFSRNSAVGEEE